MVAQKLIAPFLFVLFTGCGASEPQAAGDCSVAVRSDGVVYFEVGFVQAPAQPAGKADAADCDDNGEDARGAYFPEAARQVDVLSFDGQEPRTVLGVRESNGTFRVFVAEDQDATRVLRALERARTEQDS